MEESTAGRPAPQPLPGAWPTESFKRESLHPGSPPEQNMQASSTTTQRDFPLSSVQSTPDTDGFEGAFIGQNFPRGHQGILEESKEMGEPSHAQVSDTLNNGKAVEDGDAQTPPLDYNEKNLLDGLAPDGGFSASGEADAQDKDDVSARTSLDEDYKEAGDFEPIKTNQSRSKLAKQGSRPKTEEDIMRTLSRKWTKASGRQGSYAVSTEEQEEQEEIQRLMSRMFGKDRKAQSEDEKTRHVGVIWKHLTVKGMGLGAAIQPTIGDPFLAPFRLLAGLFTNPRRATGKPPIRTLLNDFSGCVRPGEMLLVLGRPGAGCSTFLKMFGNQRFGYKEIKGDVTYGGTSAEKMGKDFRGEVLYNPEDDLHYATLSVKNTLKFALKTKTPGKASRNEGETRSQYVREFLRVVTKLFWIEHTMNTKVGNEYVRGVSGGEKKRVSIAEAMITRTSSQAWDNSTRGLDASTALEYVQAIRTLTNMAQVSTAVALYQAGESLYDLFDKVPIHAMPPQTAANLAR